MRGFVWDSRMSKRHLDEVTAAVTAGKDLSMADQVAPIGSGEIDLSQHESVDEVMPPPLEGTIPPQPTSAAEEGAELLRQAQALDDTLIIDHPQLHIEYDPEMDMLKVIEGDEVVHFQGAVLRMWLTKGGPIPGIYRCFRRPRGGITFELVKMEQE